MKYIVSIFITIFSLYLSAPQRPVINDSLIGVHDPVIIRMDSTYYVFCTGPGITAFSSADKKHWKQLNPVFKAAPEWAVKATSNFKGHIWAPDISYHNGQYYLYYAVSTFGKNTSCIGLATNKTLNPAASIFKWIDQGKIIQSVPGTDMWNAIDPNLIIDENNTGWMTFGSFWNGIKLVKLNSTLTVMAQPELWFTIASRKRNDSLADTDPGDAAIEAPFIYKHQNYYYLFTSFDYCCRGEKSTYKIMVGRSETIMGPYMDKEGTALIAGGDSLVLEGNKNWFGVQHNAVAAFKGIDYLVFHGYNAADKRKSKLRIEKLKWINGWPVVEFFKG